MKKVKSRQYRIQKVVRKVKDGKFASKSYAKRYPHLVKEQRVRVMLDKK